MSSRMGRWVDRTFGSTFIIHHSHNPSTKSQQSIYIVKSIYS